MTSLNDLQNNGYERHKKCSEKTLGKGLQNQVVMKMSACTMTELQRQRKGVLLWNTENTTQKIQYRKMHGTRINTNSKKWGQTYV